MPFPHGSHSPHCSIATIADCPPRPISGAQADETFSEGRNEMEWAMTNEQTSGETLGAKALMFALLAGAALLFVEVTLPAGPAAHEQAPVAQTAAHHERVASN